MTTDEIAAALVEWAQDVIPSLEDAYSHTVATKNKLPDVVCDILSTRVELTDPEFPYRDLQQMMIVRHELQLSFMVDNTDTEAASGQLRSFADSLLISILQDGTLGDRVPYVSPYVNFDYTPPFVQYADGTEGREMTMTLAIADPVEVAQ